MNRFMTSLTRLALGAALWLTAGPVAAQIQGKNPELDNVGDLRAATKQLNQFIKRFNNEEDQNGKAHDPKSKQFREAGFRQKYLQILFDGQNSGLSQATKNEFVAEVAGRASSQQFLDFYGGRWLAEVAAKVNYQGREEDATFFFDLEKDNNGWKWVLNKVYFKPFRDMFVKDAAPGTKFIHPMSHELGFFNLNKAFADAPNFEEYTPRAHTPDYLSLFVYEVKRGGITFNAVAGTKFHFFQLKDWYFEVREFNRPGNNSGWLIANLTKVPENQKSALYKFIYKE
jgi:hypothetical protein